MHLDFVNRSLPLLLTCFVILAGGWHDGILNDEGERGPGVNAAPALEGVVIVKFRSSVTAGKSTASGIASFDRLAQRLQTENLRQLFPAATFKPGKTSTDLEQIQSLQRIYEVRYGADVPPHVAAALLSSDPGVEFAEPRYLYHITGFIDASTPSSEAGSKIVPNDPQFSEMSHLAHVSLPQAWDIVKSNQGNVVIGIVDAGTEWRHRDLVTNIWQSPGDQEGNGVDDDLNGYVDDVRGWNFANDSNDPTGLGRTEVNAIHGTLVAGIASAVTDNEEGIAGASWNARLLPVNAGCANTDNAICYGFEGVLYAVMQGADVICTSWGGPDSFLGREVVKMALDRGVLLVASAGNGDGVDPVGINIDERRAYPAAYDRVLVVGATLKQDDQIAEFSNYGLSVDVFAPGVALNGTVPGNGYTSQASGTSFSTPIVVGLAALLRTKHPDWTLDQIREQIRVSCDPIDEANVAALTGLLGKGRINALRALSDTTLPAVRVRQFEVTDSGMDGAIQPGEFVTLDVEFVNYLAEAQNITFSLSIDDPEVTIQKGSFSVPGLGTGQKVSLAFSFEVSENVPSDHELNFRLDIQESGYKDAELIRVIANRVTHDTGVLQMTLTDEGNIGWTGFQEESEGQGFKYLGVNWLAEGGLLVGTAQEKISDSIRNAEDDTQDEDFVRPEGGFFGILKSPIVAENGLVILDDSNAKSPIGIKIHQESYADDQDDTNDFIILRYIISHADEQAMDPIENLHIGLFTDWDLTQGFDYGRFDPSRKMGIVQYSNEDPVLLFATRLLNEKARYSYRSIDNDEIFDSRSNGDGFTDAEKWAFMTGGVQVQEVDNTDVSTLITAGPYSLTPGNTVEVAFALMAARSEAELNVFADRAQIFWNGTLESSPPYPVNTEEEKVPDAFSLEPPFPNPVVSQASIAFTMPAGGHIQMTVYDALGRAIQTLVDEDRAAGRYIIQWDGRNQNGESVSTGVYFYRLRAETVQGNYTSTRRIVFIN